MCLADRLPSAIGRGESKGRRARLPRVTFVTTSGLRDALSVRGDKTIAMHCRKKPRDALSVRTYSLVLAFLCRHRICKGWTLLLRFLAPITIPGGLRIEVSR